MSSQEPGTNGVALTELQDRLAADIAAAGGAMPPDPELAGAVGCTMFDLPGSEDLSLTILLSHANLQRLPAQALERGRCVGMADRTSERAGIPAVAPGPQGRWPAGAC